MIFTIFISSFLVITSLLLIKMYEVSSERSIFITKKLASFDPAVNLRLNDIRNVSNNSFEKASILIRKDLPFHIKDNINLIKVVTKNKYQTILPNIRGIKVLNGNGNGKVSRFLHEIQIDREKVGKGSIEDNGVVSSL